MLQWRRSRTSLEGDSVAKVKRRRPRRQYAALPLASGADGQRLVMLVTSRETGRWVIPKGWAEKRLEPHQVAAKEAFEEAGLEGEIGRESLATYHYVKRLQGKRTVPCTVTVFPLAVARQLEDWPEKKQRETRWFTPAEAALLVAEGGLVTLLLELAAPDG